MPEFRPLETIDIQPAEDEPGEWVPVHFLITFEDGVKEETTDFYHIRRLVDTHLETRKQKPVNIWVQMADGFEVEVDAIRGRIRLGDIWVQFRETDSTWLKELLWFRRVRSEVRAYEPGGPGSQPISSYLHAYGFGFAVGDARRVFLLRASHDIQLEM